MDLFAFIHHSDPTKVRIGEREVGEGEVPFLELTRGRFVSLAGVNEQGNQNDDVEGARNQNDDAGNNVAEEGAADGQGVPVDAGIIHIEMRFWTSDELVHASIFADFAFVCKVGPDVAGPSQPVSTELSADSFYVSQDMDSEMMRQIYVPKWEVLNESALDDSDMCRSMVNHLAPPVFFPSCAVWIMTIYLLSLMLGQHARYALALRMRLEHTLREKKRLEGRFNRQADLLKEMDAEMASLKAQLLLKEAEAAVAIHLHGQIATRWILSRRLKLVVMKCLQSPEYLAALGVVIGRAIDKGMQDGLAAGIDHGKARKGLAKVAAYKPVAEANYVSAMNALCAVDFPLLAQLASHKDASISDLIDLLFLEGLVVETPEANQLQPSPEQLMLPIHRNVAGRRLSISDAMIPLIEPLSPKNLIGEVSTFEVPAMAITTALSTTFIQTSFVPPVSVADYEVLDARLSAKVHSPPTIVFRRRHWSLRRSMVRPTKSSICYCDFIFAPQSHVTLFVAVVYT
nr:hypothetical protein [Tanacetum cinerariifolium]